MTHRFSRERGLQSAPPVRVSMRLQPSVGPSRRDNLLLIVVAVAAVSAGCIAGVCWFSGEGQKPIAKVDRAVDLPKPSAPAAPAKLAVGLPPITIPPAPPAGAAPQQPG